MNFDFITLYNNVLHHALLSLQQATIDSATLEICSKSLLPYPPPDASPDPQSKHRPKKSQGSVHLADLAYCTALILLLSADDINCV